jgi:hypothetical protein
VNWQFVRSDIPNLECASASVSFRAAAADEDLYMNFVLIIWFISQSAIAVTSAQFERMEECRRPAICSE